VAIEKDYVNKGYVAICQTLPIISSEDQLFTDHRVYWKSIQPWNIIRKPNRVRGASTISRQTAKRCFYGKQKLVEKSTGDHFTHDRKMVWASKIRCITSVRWARDFSVLSSSAALFPPLAGATGGR
jgi:monofunctional biosynthetic peptidoglycan transglycosylase